MALLQGVGLPRGVELVALVRLVGLGVAVLAWPVSGAVRQQGRCKVRGARLLLRSGGRPRQGSAGARGAASAARAASPEVHF